MSDLSGLNPTPHAIAVYASRPLSLGATQHSLPSGRYPLLGPVFHRLDRTSLPGALIRSPRQRELAAKAEWWARLPGHARHLSRCDQASRTIQEYKIMSDPGIVINGEPAYARSVSDT